MTLENLLDTPIGDIIGNTLDSMPESHLRHFERLFKEDMGSSLLMSLAAFPVGVLLGNLIVSAAAGEYNMIQDIIKGIKGKIRDKETVKFILDDIKINRKKYEDIVHTIAEKSNDTDSFIDLRDMASKLYKFLKNPSMDSKILMDAFKNMDSYGKKFVSKLVATQPEEMDKFKKDRGMSSGKAHSFEDEDFDDVFM
jgi:hypothetical protein